jgi:REP element-mobilizing transposase RayT
MSNYRRAKIPGGYYFFTVVTYNRQPLFGDESARVCLRQVWKDVQHRWPFTVVALCLLPEHLHCIWKLPDGDDNYSTRWSLIKRRFAQQYRGMTTCRVDSLPVHADFVRNERSACRVDSFAVHADFVRNERSACRVDSFAVHADFVRNERSACRVDSSAVHADITHPALTPSGIKRNESGIWQRRFWEHYLKDGRDIQRHIAYIHYNPVKHGLVEKPQDWSWSTYKSYVESGRYAIVDYVDLQQEMTAAIEGE